MRILVLNGSPKKKSDTFRLTDAFLKGLNRAKRSRHVTAALAAGSWKTGTA